ncbi:MAG: hypothetical protein ABEJ65_06685, partial [bacterium]
LGEVGLTGRLRSPGQLTHRLKETQRLDTGPVMIGGGSDQSDGDEILGASSIAEVADRLIQ